MFLGIFAAAALSIAGITAYGAIIGSALVLFLRRHVVMYSPDIFGIFFLAFLLIGGVVGALNVFFDRNDVVDYFQYLFIHTAQYIAYCTGRRGFFSVPVARKMIVGLFWVDLATGLVRLTGGLGIRSSAGFSPLLVSVVHDFVNRRSFFMYLLAALLIALSLLISVGSGLRSITVAGALVCAVAFLVLVLGARSGSLSSFSSVRSLVPGFAIIAFTVLALLNLELLQRMVEITIFRFQVTFFSDLGFRLDPGYGRTDEAWAAIAEFQSNQVAIDVLFGRGFGFVFPYFDGYADSLSAHVHVTPVAYYVRGGVFGIIFWSFVCIFCIVNIFKSARGASADAKYLSLSIFVYLGFSFFSAYVLGPAFWFLLGWHAALVRLDAT